MIVNTASECAYTLQYGALQELYLHFKEQGLEVIAFPSDDFGSQEPGSDRHIEHFCKSNYGVTFPVMSKGAVIGEKANQVFKWLADADLNGRKAAIPEWNFAKFLVDERGNLIAQVPASEHPACEIVLEWLNA